MTWEKLGFAPTLSHASFPKQEGEWEGNSLLQSRPEKNSFPSPQLYLAWDFRLRQRSEQYFTSSQQSAHFLRQLKGSPQTGQILVGRSDLERWRAMLSWR